LWGGHLLSRSIEVLLRQSNGPTLDLGLDLRVLAYTVGIAIACALLFGLAPAFRAARADVQDSLKAHGRGLTTGHLRLPRVLVGAQMALCLAVLVAAGLLGRSLANIRLTDLGFDGEHLAYASANPWRSGMPASHVDGYVTRMQEELSRIPGVRRVGTIGSRPLSGSSSMTTAHLAGRPYRQDGVDAIMLNELGPGVVETLGLRLLAGRSFEPRDARPGADTVLVDERFAKHFYPEGNPVGQRFGTDKNDTASQVIIGVVSNSRYRSLRDEDLRPTIFRPMVPGEHRGGTVHFVIRTAANNPGLANEIRRAAERVDPDVPIIEFFTQSGLIDRQLQTERILSLVSRAFSVVAVALAAVGLGGLLFYAVTRRTNEIGIRMAMGAAPGDVARMVMRDSLALVAAGAVLGIPAAVLLARTLKSQLTGVTATDLPTTGGALAILLALAMLAAWLPARRAAAIEPTSALREE
jgi:predicted permease